MTGAELLAELQKLTADQLAYAVRTEGCDCWGGVARVELAHRIREIELYRPEDGS